MSGLPPPFAPGGPSTPYPNAPNTSAPTDPVYVRNLQGPACPRCPDSPYCPSSDGSGVIFYSKDNFYGQAQEFQLTDRLQAFQAQGGQLCHDANSPWPSDLAWSEPIGFVPQSLYHSGDYAVHVHGFADTGEGCGQQTVELCPCGKQECDFNHLLTYEQRSDLLGDRQGGIYFTRCHGAASEEEHGEEGGAEEGEAEEEGSGLPTTPAPPTEAPIPDGNCIVSPWSNWTGCSTHCGEGIQTRRRRVERPPQGEGDPCPPLSEAKPCRVGGTRFAQYQPETGACHCYRDFTNGGFPDYSNPDYWPSTNCVWMDREVAVGSDLLAGQHCSQMNDLYLVKEETGVDHIQDCYTACSCDPATRVRVAGGGDGLHPDTPDSPESGIAMMGVPRYGHTATALGGFIYAVGGASSYNMETTYSFCERYDPTKNRWTPIAALPKRRYYHSACALGNLLYVIGGRETSGGPPTSSVYIYDPTHDAWARGPDTQEPRVMPVIGTIGGQLYISGLYKTSEVYNSATRSWKYLANTPISLYGSGSGVSGSSIYTVTSSEETPVTNYTYGYDTVANTWKALAPPPVATDEISTCMIGGALYLLGGLQGNQALSSVYSYDTTSNKWTGETPLRQVLFGTRAVLLGGKVYLVGGQHETVGQATSWVGLYKSSG